MQPRKTLISPNSEKTLISHQIFVFLLTFTAYASFHASRKPPSIVKSVLAPENPNSDLIDTGWAPFNDSSGTSRLGELDLAFLSAYSIGMYFAGDIGDRINLRNFLCFGMFGSGLFTIIFGLGFWLNIHEFGFFVVVQIVCGLFQSIGWPCVVAIVGNWFGKSKRGLIMGVWNSHTSVGNIVGSVLASAVLEFGWGWSFVLPGLGIIFVGVVVFGFLVVSPEDVGLEVLKREVEMNSEVKGAEKSLEKTDSEQASLLMSDSNEAEAEAEAVAAIGFIKAWRLPRVASYAFCLFFSKLVAYTFLYWLPFYIRRTVVAGVQLSHKSAGILSTVFDVGGVLGGISAGYISDKIEARAITSVPNAVLLLPR